VALAALGGRPPLLEPTLGQRLQRDVVQHGHDQVRTSRGQHLLVTEAGHADGRHPGRLGRLDPAGGVLDHEARTRFDAELFGGGQEDGRVGLAPGEVAARDVGVEQLLQRHPRADEVVVQPLLGREGVQPDPGQE
jgi:hypothetical protein